MITSEASLNKLIRDSVDEIVGISGYTVAAKQDDAPRAIGPYAEVDFVSDTMVGWEEFKNTDDSSDVNRRAEGLRRIMYSISFFRDDAVDNSRLVRLGLVRNTIQSVWNRVNVKLNSRSDVREISFALNSGWEERSQFDLMLSVVDTDEDIVAAIESVSIDGKVEFGSKTFNVDIEVS